MNQELEQKLARMAKQLNPGEMKELVFDQRKIDTGDKQVIIAQLVKEPTLTEKFEREVANIGRDKVVQFPFEAHREGNDKVVISGVIDQENVKRAVEVAAAGAHNCLCIGPPGSRKNNDSKKNSHNFTRFKF